MKNIRSTIYPRSREVWDLLGKVGYFPEHVPILVTRRIHFTTARFFRAIGALAFEARRQWFSPEIDGRRFDGIKRLFGFSDLTRPNNPDAPHPPLSRFFTETLYKPADADTVMGRSHKQWQVAAPIAAQYADLREDLPPHKRDDLWDDFTYDILQAGIDPSGWFSPDP